MTWHDYSAPFATTSLPQTSAEPSHLRDAFAWAPSTPPVLFSRQYDGLPFATPLPAVVPAYATVPPECTMSCSAPPTAPTFNSVPIYNVSYSLAGALTPVDAPKLQRANTTVLRAGSLSPASRYYSSEVPSPRKEYCSEPFDTSCSKSSTSPSPSPPTVKQEELPDVPHCSPFSSDSLSNEGSKSRSRPGNSKARGGRANGSGDPQYLCDICSAEFIRKHDGERHRRSHTDERPFPCYGGCGKAFRRSDARSRHWGVFRDCELRHDSFIEGTPEGAQRKRRLLKRAKRADLVMQGVALPVIRRILRNM